MNVMEKVFLLKKIKNGSMNNMSLKVFFDTNELLDWALIRTKNYPNAKDALKKVFDRDILGYVTGHSLTDFFYITRKDLSKEDRHQFLLMMANNFTILTEPNDAFLSVLTDPNFSDLEDGLQMQCAKDAVLDYIVTENIEHFKNSKVQALTAQEFNALYEAM